MENRNMGGKIAQEKSKSKITNMLLQGGKNAENIINGVEVQPCLYLKIKKFNKNKKTKDNKK